MLIKKLSKVYIINNIKGKQRIFRKLIILIFLLYILSNSIIRHINNAIKTNVKKDLPRRNIIENKNKIKIVEKNRNFKLGNFMKFTVFKKKLIVATVSSYSLKVFINRFFK